MIIAVHGKEFKKASKPIIDEVFKQLKAHGIEFVISEPYAKIIASSSVTIDPFNIYNPDNILDNVDLYLSMGGDGTLLETVTHVGKSEKPILGINIGKLGFLATISENGIEKAFSSVKKGKYSLDERTLIKLESGEDVFEGNNFALNDFTILKKDTSSMIVVHAFINNDFLNSYWADGLIVSTPTGSTGYSLSCGGPIVLTQSNTFIITPVSPHNLAVRPIVVSDDNIISFKMESRKKKVLVSLDSRHHTINANTELVVRKEDFKAKLIKIEGHSFFDTLRQKLTWGYDVRN